VANPTTNYGFVMPTPTDLVTDLPADFGVFGQAVDTQMKTNADAATQKATLTTKGDIYAASGTSTPARLAVGANDTVLTADSTTATGLKWATVSAGPTLIATASLVGVSTYTISSIPSTYQTLWLQCKNMIDGSAEDVKVRINGDTGANYYRTVLVATSATVSNVSAATSWQVGRSGSVQNGYFDMYFPQYANTNLYKSYYANSIYGGYPNAYSFGVNGTNTQRNVAISSITVINENSINWTSGTITLWGSN
jgi:hypothetical protein